MIGSSWSKVRSFRFQSKFGFKFRVRTDRRQIFHIIWRFPNGLYNVEAHPLVSLLSGPRCPTEEWEREPLKILSASKVGHVESVFNSSCGTGQYQAGITKFATLANLRIVLNLSMQQTYELAETMEFGGLDFALAVTLKWPEKDPAASEWPSSICSLRSGLRTTARTLIRPLTDRRTGRASEAAGQSATEWLVRIKNVYSKRLIWAVWPDRSANFSILNNDDDTAWHRRMFAMSSDICCLFKFLPLPLVF